MYLKLLVLTVFTISIKKTYSTKVVEIKQNFENGKLMHYAYLKASDTWLARAYYDVYYNSTGWDVFETETNKKVPDEQQAYGAGLLEGSMTSEAILYTHYYNNFNNYCKNKENLCKKLDKFLDSNTKWVKKMIKEYGKRSSPWHHVKLIYKQIEGIYDGYKLSSSPDKQLTYKDILKINVQMDLDDVAEALKATKIHSKVKGFSRCSAIIKLLPNNSDVVIGHTTWSGYNSMVRILKRYNHYYRTSSHSTMTVFGVSMAFSGYPGVISSGDDFYVMNSKLVAMETTIGNSNSSLWSLINPETIFEPIRAVVANRLANNGRSWGEYFCPYNSGTYNNQWMIIDLNKFTPGSKPLLGLLYILEQIPGYIRMEDQTLLFLNQTYWSSYNTPYYEDVFNMSGNQELVKKYGDWFTYNKTPRALIFKRDHSNVKDIDTLLTLLRSNDYQHDEFGKCKCIPPYSAENAIASRSDLNPANGTYPFPALGHRAHGAVDAKVTSSEWILTTQFKAICGPTTGSGLPEFKWSTSDFKDRISHQGQPDSFEFDPVVITWYWNTTLD